ncbi:uncharacterized protein LOC129591139 [Paramacrobiotus metropolitanus]|uniref:uncharacterized protein LOC129591139 n=1 Tax=Paramacrobiotus metropolitanus TaxID=2943436 RepID=UPI00244586FC|nr:uncharacterized protein LOC129591139 [Paramacrobiotus metropolitanus]
MGALQGSEGRAVVLIFVGNLNLIVEGTCLFIAAVTLRRDRLPLTFRNWCIGTTNGPGNTSTSSAEFSLRFVVFSCALELPYVLLSLPSIVIYQIRGHQETGKTVYFMLISRSWRVMSSIFGLSGLFRGQQVDAPAPYTRQPSQPVFSRFILIYVCCQIVRALLSVGALTEAALDPSAGHSSNQWTMLDEGLALGMQACLAVVGLLMRFCGTDVPAPDAVISLTISAPPPSETPNDANTPLAVVENMLPLTNTTTEDVPPFSAVTIQRESDLPPPYAEVMKANTGKGMRGPCNARPL